eukprot:TRINITY_DN14470_c0_g1_i11.p1 TRINITY_DN14470_c0_g1~~TRINITY_DN14470_c0_g1_i11.p1  ORF type:complete len:371 (-),score=56.88 TRINITY_DN14470_c0_g1_i11:38-1150(-)
MASKKCVKSGGVCAEMKWGPTLQQLQGQFAQRAEAGSGRQIKLDAATETLRETCGFCDGAVGICARKRWVGGTLATVRLGGVPLVRQLADHLPVWHWYPLSAKFKSSWGVEAWRTMSPSPVLEADECVGTSASENTSSCCIAGASDRWATLLEKLNSVADSSSGAGQVFNVDKSGRKFSYVITAPQNSEDIELRAAREKGEHWNTFLHDLVSKHIWLNNFKDWALMAGELWVQPKIGVEDKENIPLSDVMLIIDSKSGTMMPTPDLASRLAIQRMLTTALGVGADQIQVCAGPLKPKVLPGFHPVMDWKEGETACPDLVHFYPKEVAKGYAGPEAAMVLATLKAQRWSDERGVVLPHSPDDPAEELDDTH